MDRMGEITMSRTTRDLIHKGFESLEKGEKGESPKKDESDESSETSESLGLEGNVIMALLFASWAFILILALVAALTGDPNGTT